jgi:energy-coupling factor transporter ATP-binding protein EcfA2
MPQYARGHGKVPGQRQLAPSQREALRQVLGNRSVVITGAPGVGKTTLIHSLLTIVRAKKIRCFLTAPTGRAAKRLNEATGLEAKTNHRLLEGKRQAKPCVVGGELVLKLEDEWRSDRGKAASPQPSRGGAVGGTVRREWFTATGVLREAWTIVVNAEPPSERATETG